MTKLQTLRSRLLLLRNLRSSMRWLSALAAVATTVIVALLAIFAIDYLCELYVAQRVVLLVVGVLLSLVAFRYLAWPLLTVRESTTDMALLVERSNKIDSDLVAALQFEGPQAARWGSTQLSGAVVDYMAQVSPGLHVFDGLGAQQLVGRLMALVVAGAVAFGLIAWMPGHASAFWQRMLLGDAHYPTATQIARVQINGRVLLSPDDARHQPQRMVSPQARPLAFGVLCTGVLENRRGPVPGKIRLQAESGAQSAAIDLERLTAEDRLAQLTSARDLVAAAIADRNLAGAASPEIYDLLSGDAPDTYEALASAENLQAVQASLEKLDRQIASPPDAWKKNAWYRARWDRFTAPIAYQILVGDAWTEWADIDMIPLPSVELRLSPVAPEYARQAEMKHPTAANVRQISVLEGSQVGVAVLVTNDKPLASVELLAETAAGEQRFPLESKDDSGMEWFLPPDNPLFSNVRSEVRFQITATDSDELHLERPVEGSIRLRSDRSPSGQLAMANQNRVLLPQGRPLLAYSASDDYGVSQIGLEVQIERARPLDPVDDTATTESETPDAKPAAPATSDDGSASAADDPAQSVQVAAPEQKSIVLLDKTVMAGELPFSGRFRLETSAWNLSPGDRLKLSLKVVDYRGDRPGETWLGEPIVLDITDLSGVRAGLTELDEAFEKRSNELLEIELGIGESP
ncbi:hypothetical protein [Lignipirellula cremea]|uniref:Uncharacterized protein n=1 Tax=Lignipirellula cremea TaxID=2528010 RepID=A0A518E260_9BACT|nr:hypothetical protein [Lignipirellula cremea]QDU98179.1 hypothetical protein Pla8534_60400 [Lignipirellula cremea]